MADDLCREDACEREDLHVEHPVTSLRLSRKRQLLNEDGTVTDIPAIYKLRIIASAPFVVELYGDSCVEMAVRERDSGQVWEGRRISMQSSERRRYFEVRIGHMTLAKPRVCVAAFPGDGEFKHFFPPAREIRFKTNSEQPLWRMSSPQALDESIVRAVSRFEAKTFGLLKQEVENDFGSIGPNEIAACRTLHRRLEGLIEAGRVVREYVGGHLHAYFAPGSPLAEDPETLYEQMRAVTQAEAW